MRRVGRAPHPEPGAASQREGAGWIWALRWLDLDRVHLDRIASLGLLAGVVAARVAVFPRSIWEQDEAYLACGVVEYDVAAFHPHVPGFPLWVLLGKLVEPLVSAPERALQWVSVVLSVVGIAAVMALWSLLLERRQAALAALLFAFAPGPWLLSGRAFTGPAATAIAAAALASWLWPGDRSACRVAGSALAAAAVLVRPHVLPLLVPALLWRLWRDRRHPAAIGQTVMVLVGTVAIGAGLVVADTGGITPYWMAMTEHAQYHFTALAELSWQWSDLSAVVALGSLPVAVAWWLSAAVGWALWLQDPTRRVLAGVLLAGLCAQLIVLLELQNATHPRYAVPLLALSAGPVIACWSWLGTAWRRCGVAALMAVWLVQVLPAAQEYRSAVAPPLAALQAGADEACAREGVLVIDRTLVAFEDLLRCRGELEATVLRDVDLERGGFDAPPPGRTVVVWDLRRGPPPVEGGEWQLFSVGSPLLRRLSQERFLDVAVVAGGAYTVR